MVSPSCRFVPAECAAHGYIFLDLEIARKRSSVNEIVREIALF